MGRNAADAQRNVCATMGPVCVSYDTAKHGFRRFAEGNFDLDDEPHPGRAVQVNVNALEAAVEEEDPRLTRRCLAERFGCHHTAVARRFHALGSFNFE
jgi:hypothetical protein